MKRNCWILTILVVSVCLVQPGCGQQASIAQTSEADSKTPESKADPGKIEIPTQTVEAGPRIAFEKVIHDFGRVGPSTYNNCEFKFANTGTETLKIGKINATCGCTVPKLSKQEYAPGESGTVKIKYHSGPRPGSATKILYVPSNDKTNPKVTLTILANIEVQVVHKPEKLELLLEGENIESPEITLTSLDGKPFAITGIRATGNSITADYDRSVEKTEFVIQTKVDTEILKNKQRGAIHINVTHPQCDTVIVPFSLVTRFKIKPPTIIVFNAKPQEPIKKELWILSNYDEDFEIESVLSKKGIIKVSSQEKIGNRYKLELQITPPVARDKKRMFTDQFSVNIKGDEELQIPCRGFYSKNRPNNK